MTDVTTVALRVWGKTDQRSAYADLQTVRWQPLLAHLLDVVAVAYEILSWEGPGRKASLIRALRLPPGAPVDRWMWLLAVLAGLHDLGKATPTFQDQHPLGRQLLPELKFPPASLPLQARHGLMTERLLGHQLTPLGFHARTARLLGEAVGMHHGERFHGDREAEASGAHLGHTLKGGSVSWEEVQTKLIVQVFRAAGFGRRELSGMATVLNQIPNRPTGELGGFMLLLAGLTSAADWVGSSMNGGLAHHPDFTALADPGAYLTRARTLARRQLRRLTWLPAGHQPGSDLDELLREEQKQVVALEPFPLQAPPPFPAGNLKDDLEQAFSYVMPGGAFRLRALQEEVADMVVRLPSDETGLVLIEGPMGIGKTEAALMVWLLRRDQLRGLYLGEPSMASGNAMYPRLAEFLRAQGLEGRASYGLTHGASVLSKDYRAALGRADPLAAQRVAAELGEGPVASTWMNGGGRGMLAPFAVGTIDQLLLGVLGVKHHFVRLWGVSDRLVILDEVHAYDTYTSSLMERLVCWLGAIGATVVVMSATLPAASRQALLNAWRQGHGLAPSPVPVQSPVQSPGYPRVELVSSAGRHDLRQLSHAVGRALKVRLKAAPVDTALLAKLATDLTLPGGTTGVICNTVARAQKLYQETRDELTRRGVPVRTLTDRVTDFEARPFHEDDQGAVLLHLLHAQYPGDERAARELEVLQRLGKPGADGVLRPERMIVIATQVIEQSLDIDLDVLISDLAPIDLLLQRLGRMWRHDRPGPGARHAHTEPVLYVAGLRNWPEERVLKDTAWKFVYPEALLLRAWTLLHPRLEDTIDIPADLDALVQRGYAPTFDASTLSVLQQETLADAWKRLQADILRDAGIASSVRIPVPEAYVEHIVPGDPTAAAEGSGDDPDENEDRPVTRLGRLSVRMVPVTRNGDAWEVIGGPFSPARSARLDTLRRSELDEAIAIYSRSLRVSRSELVQALLQSSVSVGERGKTGWASVPLLMDCIPLEFTHGLAEVPSGSRTLYLRLHPELGLQYSKYPLSPI